MIQLQVMHGGHLFSSYLGTSQNEATGSAVPRIVSHACGEKKNIGEKENVQIKGMISTRMLIISYSIQQVILNVCTKLQNPR